MLDLFMFVENKINDFDFYEHQILIVATQFVIKSEQFFDIVIVKKLDFCIEFEIMLFKFTNSHTIFIIFDRNLTNENFQQSNTHDTCMTLVIFYEFIRISLNNHDKN